MPRKPASAAQRRRGAALGEAIRHARPQSTSREDVARQADVSTAEVKALEEGRIANPGFFIVADLARVLGIGLADLDAAAAPPDGGEFT